MARKNKINTKLELLHIALHLFMVKGYTNTSVSDICNEIGVSKGIVAFHFHTKEHLLAELIHMLCDFQWKMMEREAEEGKSSLVAYLLELATMASVCDENPVAKDLYVSAYIHPMSLQIIRKNDTRKARNVFSEYCKDWQENDYREAENIVSGIEYSMFMKENTETLSLEQRIASSLDGVMKIYELPKEIRQKKIEKVMSMNYSEIGRNILQEFTKYVEERSMQELMKANKKPKGDVSK